MILAKVFLYFVVTKHNQGPEENWRWPKSPLEEESGNSELVNFFTLTCYKEFRGMKNLYFPKDNIVILCSNYDKRYHKKRRWGSLSSSDDPEEHSMSPDDQRVVVVASHPPKQKK